MKTVVKRSRKREPKTFESEILDPINAVLPFESDCHWCTSTVRVESTSDLRWTNLQIYAFTKRKRLGFICPECGYFTPPWKNIVPLDDKFRRGFPTSIDALDMYDMHNEDADLLPTAFLMTTWKYIDWRDENGL